MSSASWRLSGDKIAELGDRPAIASRSAAGSVVVTYAELAARAAGVWRYLRRVGVLPGDPVGLVSSGRAQDEAVGLVGIVTSGSVAIPLDATAPPQRLASILRARGARAIVLDAQASSIASAIDAELARATPDDPRRLARVTLDSSGAVISDDRGDDRPAPAAEIEARRAIGSIGEVACVLHTSGSTGTPKPVPITWAGLDAFTAWSIDQIALGPSDRVLRVAELIFDLAWFDHLAALRAGAMLVTMSRRELAAGAALRDAIRELAPTVIYGVPSLFMKLRAALPEGELLPASVRAVLFAGEVFPPRELALFAERAPNAELYNFYGPTETNVCTYHRVDRATLDGERETPIGRACPYARCSLVQIDTDEDPDATSDATPRGRSAKDSSSGVRGRVIEGPGVGELVVEGPTTIGGGPYATRDRVERGADGLFYFRGRIDRMVKIRGYRVEPGEVEAALGAHVAVRQAAVIVHDDARLGKTLRAFVELLPGAVDPGDRALRIFLAERLPSYMVPEKVLIFGELPRTPTGKIDYRSLKAAPLR